MTRIESFCNYRSDRIVEVLGTIVGSVLTGVEYLYLAQLPWWSEDGYNVLSCGASLRFGETALAITWTANGPLLGLQLITGADVAGIRSLLRDDVRSEDVTASSLLQPLVGQVVEVADDLWEDTSEPGYSALSGVEFTTRAGTFAICLGGEGSAGVEYEPDSVVLIHDPAVVSTYLIDLAKMPGGAPRRGSAMV